MREGWEVTTLDKVLTPVVRKVPVHSLDAVPWAGVRWYLGGVYPRAIERPELVKTKFLKQVEMGDVVYNRMWATRGAFGVVKEDTAGCVVSNDFPTFEAAPEYTTPEYIERLFHSALFLKMAADRASGTTERRRLKEQDFLSISVPLPPLHEQRRIVDLMDSVDAAISAAQAEVDASVELRFDLFDGLVQQFVAESEVRTLGELGKFIRGRRFTKSDYVEDGLGCIHYGQVHTHFGLTANQPVTFVPVEMKGKLRFATTGDVVIAATSEDIDALGKATVWLGADDVAVHDDCQIFRHDLDPLFATHLIASHDFHRQKVQYAAGTKVTRISGPNLAKIEVRVPERPQQEEIGRTMASLDFVVEKAQESLGRLRDLRSSMLSVLLSGEHEIPESYDQFLDLSEVVQAG